MLTTQEIRDRASNFGCCSLNSLYSYVQSKIYGDDKCAEKSWRMFLYLRWAQTKMCDPCWTDAQKSDLAKKVDCLCSPCVCNEPEDIDCTITPDYEVIDAIPFDELPAEPTDGDSYYITEGDNAGRIATWSSEDSQWVYNPIGAYVTVETGTGVLWTNLGDGPGLLFPTATLTLVGNALWEITSNSTQTQQNRQVQLLGYGDGVPQQGYVLWEGTEADIPSVLNLFGLPFDSLRLRYILPNGCEYLSDVLTTIPEDPNGCGTIDYVVGEPVVEDGLFTVAVTLSDQVGFPLTNCLISIDGGEAANGPVLVVGENILGPFALGQIVTITIVNAANSDCNIVFNPIVTECPVLVTNTEVINLCDGDPPQWGVVVTPVVNPDFPVTTMSYTTPVATSPVAATLISPGVFGCGPLVTATDPGPMTITIESAVNKDCEVVLGPFEPANCQFCEDCAEVSDEAVCLEVVPGIGYPDGLAIITETTEGYYSVVDEDDNLTVYEAGTPFEGLGRFCLWPSTDDGTPSGSFIGDVEAVAVTSFRTGATVPGSLVLNISDIGVFELSNVTVIQRLVIASDSGGGPVTVDATGADLLNLVELELASSVEGANLVDFLFTGPLAYLTNLRFTNGTSLPNLSVATIDSLANALNAGIIGFVIITGGLNPPASPSIASKAKRQDLYDGGWTLPASWTADLTP